MTNERWSYRHLVSFSTSIPLDNHRPIENGDDSIVEYKLARSVNASRKNNKGVTKKERKKTVTLVCLSPCATKTMHVLLVIGRFCFCGALPHEQAHAAGKKKYSIFCSDVEL